MKTQILFVHHTTSIGGAPNSMLYNILELPEDKFDVKVLFLEKEGPASKQFKEKGIKVDHLMGITNYQHADNAKIKWVRRNPIRPITQFFKMLNSVSKIKSYLSNATCDILHINTSVMLPVGLAAKSLGIKTIWHIREPIAKGILGLRRKIVRRIINISSVKIIAISKQDAKAFGESNKLEVIYDFVNFNYFNKDIYRFSFHDEIGVPHDMKIILSLGGVIHSKGADTFVKAANTILKKDKKCLFVIAGYPPSYSNRSIFFKYRSQSSKCLKLIKEFRLEDKVKFIGLRDDIPNLLASSKLLIWAGSIPHFSRPIIEAQAMKTPSIGTGFKSTYEIITQRETGLTFKPSDAQDLAAKIFSLLNDTKLYNSISNNGYKFAKENFNSNINFSKILKVYEML